MSILRRALQLSLVSATLLSVSALAADKVVQPGSQAATAATAGSPAAAGFLDKLACPSGPPAALSPAPLPRVVYFPPVGCGVCSVPECVGLTRGESCGSNPDYVCNWGGRCTEDNLSRCTCGLLEAI